MDHGDFLDSASGPHDAFLDSGPEQSGVESAARGALRNFPFAQQALAAAAPINPLSQEKTYGAELQHLTQAAEQGKAQNPIAYGVGATTGTLAPLAIPGIGEALEGEPILGNAALNAIQSASDVNVTKPTGQDLQNAAVAAAIGGGLGKAGQYVGSKLAPKAAPEIANAIEPAAKEVAAPVAEAAQKIPGPGPLLPNATEVGGRAIPNKPVAANFTPTAERVNASMTAQGLGGTPRQHMKYLLGKDPVKSLNDISKWLSEAGPNGESLIGLMDRPGELLPKIQGVHDAAGKEIGSIIDKVAPGAKVDSEGLYSTLKNLSDESYNSEAEHAIDKVARRVRGDAIVDSEGKVTGYTGIDFNALQKIKAGFGKVAGRAKEDMAGGAIKQAYGEIAQHMNDIVDAAQAQVKDPAMMARYLKSKFDYQTTSHLLPILRYQEAKELIGGPAGHFSLRGLLGTLVGTVIPSPTHVARNALLKSAPAVSGAVNAVAPIAAPIAKGAGRAIKGLTLEAQVGLENYLQSKYQQQGK